MKAGSSTLDLSGFQAAGLVSEGDMLRAAALADSLCSPALVVAFVGAGVSAAAGFPSWSALLARLHERINWKLKRRVRKTDVQLLELALLTFEADPLWRAEEYRARAGDHFLSALAHAIGREPRPTKRGRTVVQNVMRLPFNHFLTTNYDRCLEEAARQLKDKALAAKSYLWGPNPETAVALSELSRKGTRRVVHIHGMFKDPKSMILTNTDYTNFYLGTDRHAKQLFAIIATHHICFLGFSLTDPHVLRLLEQVQALGYSETRHFAVLPDPGDATRAIFSRMLEKRFGVAPIFYRMPKPNDHRNFERFLAALVKDCSRRKKEAAARPGTRETAAHVRSPAEARGTEAFWPALRASRDPDDPNRGRFGRKKQRDGLCVHAKVTPFPSDPEWFNIVLTVEKDPDAAGAFAPLRNGRPVKFHLHHTFRTRVVTVKVSGGKAKLSRYAWGAFTVGVEIPGRTCLEIDLSKEDAPMKFRGR